MATEAWKGFVHAWHNLGVVLLWSVKVVVGIPFAIATCLFIGFCVLAAAAACLFLACFCISFVYYFLKRLLEMLVECLTLCGIIKSTNLILPTSITPGIPLTIYDNFGNTSAVLLAATQHANQEVPGDPPGYIYSWYDGNIGVPPKVHLRAQDNHSSRAISNVSTGSPVQFLPPSKYPSPSRSQTSLEVLLAAESKKQIEKNTMILLTSPIHNDSQTSLEVLLAAEIKKPTRRDTDILTSPTHNDSQTLLETSVAAEIKKATKKDNIIHPNSLIHKSSLEVLLAWGDPIITKKDS